MDSAPVTAASAAASSTRSGDSPAPRSRRRGVDGRRPRVDHRLVADRGLAARDHAVARRGEHGDQRVGVEFGRVASGLCRLQVRGAEQRSGRAADRGDELRRDGLEDRTRRVERAGVDGLEHGAEATVEVLAVVPVADLPVERDELSPVFVDRRGGAAHPVDGPCGVERQFVSLRAMCRSQRPQRSAGVSTGASQRVVRSSSSTVTVSENPCISRDVTWSPTKLRATSKPRSASTSAARR